MAVELLKVNIKVMKMNTKLIINKILSYTDLHTTICMASMSKEFRIFNQLTCANNWDKLMQIYLRIYNYQNVKSDNFIMSFIEYASYKVIKRMINGCYKPKILVAVISKYPSLYKYIGKRIVMLHYMICSKCTHLPNDIISTARSEIKIIGKMDYIEAHFIYVLKSNSFDVWTKYHRKYHMIPSIDTNNHKLVRFYYRIGYTNFNMCILLHYKEGRNDDVIKSIDNIYLLPNDNTLILKWISLHKSEIDNIMHWYFTKQRPIHISHIFKALGITHYKIPKHPYYNKNIVARVTRAWVNDALC